MGIDSMKIKVKILSEDSTEEIDLKSGSKVYDLLKKIHLRPDTLIVLKDSTPIPVDDTLDDGQELSIINVASGG